MYISENDIEKYKGTGETNNKGDNLEEFLKKYDPNRYPNPSATVDMAIFAVDKLNSYDKCKLGELIYNVKSGESIDGELKILLIKRGNHPFIGWWALPGGFVEYKEDIKTAAYRELEEETGCTNATLTEVCVCGDVYRDPRTRVISTLYTGILDINELKFEAGDDAADALLFDISIKELDCEKVEKNDSIEKSYKKYLLSLENPKNGIYVTANVASVTNKGRFLTETEYKVVETHGISADHAALIFSAMDKFTHI